MAHETPTDISRLEEQQAKQAATNGRGNATAKAANGKSRGFCAGRQRRESLVRILRKGL